MSSRTGMPRAQLDVGMFHDPKVIALARRQQDPLATLATMGLYVAIVLASWRADEPVPGADAAPAWVLSDLETYLADLTAVGLLDEAGAVPVETLDRWMQTARAMVAGGARGAAARWGHDGGPVGGHSPGRGRGNAIDPEKEGPIDRPTARARASGTARVGSFGDIMAEMGLDPDIGKGAKQ